MTGTVRPAGPDDLAEVALLEQECFPEDPWDATYVRSAIAGELPTIGVHVALGEDEDAGRVLGYAIVSTVFELAELQRIGTRPTSRRRGIGSALLDGVVAATRRAGAGRLLLEVREHNSPALALYRRTGFVEIDRRERYYRDGTTAIVLQLDLDAADVPGAPG